MSKSKAAKRRLFRWFNKFKAKPSVFELWRDEDPKGISGTGHVLDGVVFPDGTTVVRWRRRGKQSTAAFATFRQFEQVHITKHGRTTVKWIDGFDGVGFTNKFLVALLNELTQLSKEADPADRPGIGLAVGIVSLKIKDLSINRSRHED